MNRNVSTLFQRVLSLVLAAIFLYTSAAWSLAPESFTRGRDAGRFRIQAKLMAAKGGIVILTRLGAPIAVEPKNRLAPPRERFSNRFHLIQTAHYESKLPYWYREFLVMEKNGHTAHEDPSGDARVREDAERIAELVSRHARPTTDRFDFDFQTRVGGHQLFLVQYAGFNFLRPRYYVKFQPRKEGGVGAELLQGDRLPLFVLGKDAAAQMDVIASAMNSYVKKIELQFMELDSGAQTQLKEILSLAPEDRVWVHALRPPPRKIPGEFWPRELKSEGYRRDKQTADEAILETIGRFLEGKSPRQIAGLRLLDIGAGDGTLLEKIALRFPMLNPQNFIALEKNSALAAQIRAMGFSTVQGGIEHMPFSDGTFDIVISESVMVRGIVDENEVPHIIDEIARVTRDDAHASGSGVFPKELLAAVYSARCSEQSERRLESQGAAAEAL